MVIWNGTVKPKHFTSSQDPSGIIASSQAAKPPQEMVLVQEQNRRADTSFSQIFLIIYMSVKESGRRIIFQLLFLLNRHESVSNQLPALGPQMWRGQQTHLPTDSPALNSSSHILLTSLNRLIVFDFVEQKSICRFPWNSQSRTRPLRFGYLRSQNHKNS